MLARWHGQRARMLSLTSSHCTLRILVEGEVDGANLLISCIGPIRICGPTNWNQSAIYLQPISLETGDEVIQVIDDSCGLKVIAESVEVAENVKWKSL